MARLRKAKRHGIAKANRSDEEEAAEEEVETLDDESFTPGLSPLYPKRPETEETGAAADAD